MTDPVAHRAWDDVTFTAIGCVYRQTRTAAQNQVHWGSHHVVTVQVNTAVQHVLLLHLGAET